MLDREEIIQVLYGMAGAIVVLLAYLSIWKKKEIRAEPSVESPHPFSDYKGPSAIGYTYRLNESSSIQSIRRASVTRPAGIPFEQMTLSDTMPEMFDENKT